MLWGLSRASDVWGGPPKLSDKLRRILGNCVRFREGSGEVFIRFTSGFRQDHKKAFSRLAEGSEGRFPGLVLARGEVLGRKVAGKAGGKFLDEVVHSKTSQFVWGCHLSFVLFWLLVSGRNAFAAKCVNCIVITQSRTSPKGLNCICHVVRRFVWDGKG